MLGTMTLLSASPTSGAEPCRLLGRDQVKVFVGRAMEQQLAGAVLASRVLPWCRIVLCRCWSRVSRYAVVWVFSRSRLLCNVSI